jgi:hypothetical protein
MAGFKNRMFNLLIRNSHLFQERDWDDSYLLLLRNEDKMIQRTFKTEYFVIAVIIIADPAWNQEH